MAETIVNFTRAVRQASKVLIFCYGESGSGKTFSSLLLARGLVGPQGKVFGLDTETGRMSVYADEAEIGGFMHGELTPPFSPERYVEAIAAAEAAGADALVIDSLSHEWSDIGGVLELAEGNGKKGLQKWAQPKIRHKRFVKSLLRTRLHIIGCMRAKEKFSEGIGDDGKKVLVSDGFVPEQDKRLKFEATVQFFFTNERRGVPIIEKVPGSLAPCFPEGRPISVETGRMIAEWVAGGAPVDHEFEALKRRAEDTAEEGMDALKLFWGALTHDEKRRLQPIWPNIKSIAETADKPAADPAADFPGDRPAREVA